MNPLQIARFMTQSPLRGAAIGAGVGAGTAALQHNEDGSRKSLLRGAVRGAALGGAAAGLGRAYRDTRLLDPSASALGAMGQTVKRLGTDVANFGRRQVHGFTGHYNPEAIGMHGVAHSERKVDLLKRRLADDVKHAPQRAAELEKDFEAQAASTRAAGAQAQRLRDAGLSTIPGTAKALWNRSTRGEALRAMGSTISAGGGAGGAAMTVGIPLALQAPSLMRGDESAQGGPTLKRKLLSLGGSIAAGSMVAGLPVIPQLVAGTALDAGVQRLANPKRQQV